MQIPGISDLAEKGTLPESLILVTGPSGSGKTLYCRQFFAEGLMEGNYCIYVSSSLTSKQFRNQFSSIENLEENSQFINPYLYSTEVDSQEQYSSFDSASVADIKTPDKDLTNERSTKHNQLTMTLTEIRDCIMRVMKYENGSVAAGSPYQGNKSIKSIRLIIDSLTHLAAIFGEKSVLKFVNNLSFVLKDAEAGAIFTLSTPTNEHFVNAVSSILDGRIEMKFEEYNGSLTRSIRLSSIRGIHHTPSWGSFKVSDDGSLSFGEQSSLFTCMLCGKAILGRPIVDSEFTFDSQNCLETYKKLSGVYGSNISEIGLPSEVVNVNFFFIDIVSLSNPLLSVKKQMEKIAVLNKMIGSCDAYCRSPKDKKIILPTGDGMAIGFLLNSELPFQLSVQLHHKLRMYNRTRTNEDMIGVRIGLGSGPVFVVSDVRDNQNVWGPGIILARRVMDIGDNFHILLADRIAEELIALKDEYKTAIRPITNVMIKHGQTIKLYSAFSNEFGNPESPSKIAEHFY